MRRAAINYMGRLLSNQRWYRWLQGGSWVRKANILTPIVYVLWVQDNPASIRYPEVVLDVENYSSEREPSHEEKQRE